jgi:hypothetical protein
MSVIDSFVQIFSIHFIHLISHCYVKTYHTLPPYWFVGILTFAFVLTASSLFQKLVTVFCCV